MSKPITFAVNKTQHCIDEINPTGFIVTLGLQLTGCIELQSATFLTIETLSNFDRELEVINNLKKHLVDRFTEELDKEFEEFLKTPRIPSE